MYYLLCRQNYLDPCRQLFDLNFVPVVLLPTNKSYFVAAVVSVLTEQRCHMRHQNSSSLLPRSSSKNDAGDGEGSLTRITPGHTMSHQGIPGYYRYRVS